MKKLLLLMAIMPVLSWGLLDYNCPEKLLSHARFSRFDCNARLYEHFPLRNGNNFQQDDKTQEEKSVSGNCKRATKQEATEYAQQSWTMLDWILWGFAKVLSFGQHETLLAKNEFGEKTNTPGLYRIVHDQKHIQFYTDDYLICEKLDVKVTE